MYGNFKEKRASLKKLESAADSRFKSLPKKTTSKHQRASFKARDAALANSKVASMISNHDQCPKHNYP